MIFVILFVLIGHNIFYEMLGIDLIINNVCLMLSFGKLKHVYNKCCKICILVIPKPINGDHNPVVTMSLHDININQNDNEHTNDTISNDIPSPIKPEMSTNGAINEEIAMEFNDNYTKAKTSDNENSLIDGTSKYHTDSIGDIIYEPTNIKDNININTRIRDKHSSVSIFANNLRKQTTHNNNITNNDNNKNNSNNNSIESSRTNTVTHTNIKKPKSKTITDTFKGFFNLVLDIKYDLTDTKDVDNNVVKLKLKSPLICSQQLKDMGIIQ
mmetsp:Transcript_5173/g.6430  ORF Transcript_5173/g.6430 Transcript_5173/m.6430 type:complete len:270 (+) Transcript_5173:1-810(+)